MNRAYNAFLAAYEAEKVHYRLLKEAYEKIKSGKDLSIEQYYTCIFLLNDIKLRKKNKNLKEQSMKKC